MAKELFESEWIILLLSLKLENRIVFTAKPTINFFCKFYWLKEVNVCQKANSQFAETFFVLRKTSQEFSDKTDVDSCFYQNNFDNLIICSPSIE